MKTRTLYAILLITLSMLPPVQVSGGRILRWSLQKKVRQSDLIAIGVVDELKKEYSTAKDHHWLARCTIEDPLKGQHPGHSMEFRFKLPLNPHRVEPTPHGPKAGVRYWFFLSGPRHNLVPSTMFEGFEQASEKLVIWDEDAVREDGTLPPNARGHINGIPAMEVEEAAMKEKTTALVEAAPNVREVSINVRMAGGWMADFAVHASGRIRGSHVSGSELPFVHMDSGELDDQGLVMEYLKLAEKVFLSRIPCEPVISRNDLVYIKIEPFKGETKVYQRDREGAFGDPDLKKLDALLHQHRIGAW